METRVTPSLSFSARTPRSGPRLFAEFLWAHRENGFWVSSVLGRRRTFPRFRPPAGRAKARWIHRFASTTSMRSGCCPCWFEKQPEGESRRSATGAGLADVCALGAPTTMKPLDCTRQDGRKFPLRPYRSCQLVEPRTGDFLEGGAPKT